jgi:hypothetical protein
MGEKKPKRVDVTWLRGRARGMVERNGPTAQLLHKAADYIEYLEKESSARMDAIRHLRDERTELSIQIMELEEQLTEEE